MKNTRSFNRPAGVNDVTKASEVDCRDKDKKIDPFFQTSPQSQGNHLRMNPKPNVL